MYLGKDTGKWRKVWTDIYRRKPRFGCYGVFAVVILFNYVETYYKVIQKKEKKEKKKENIRIYGGLPVCLCLSQYSLNSIPWF